MIGTGNQRAEVSMGKEKRNRPLREGGLPMMTEAMRRKIFLENTMNYVTVGATLVIFFLYLIPAIDMAERAYRLFGYLNDLVFRFPLTWILGLALTGAIAAMYLLQDVRGYGLQTAIYALSLLFSFQVWKIMQSTVTALQILIIVAKTVMLIIAVYRLRRAFYKSIDPKLSTARSCRLEKKRRLELLKTHDGEPVRNVVAQMRKIIGMHVLKSTAATYFYRFCNEIMVISLTLYFITGIATDSMGAGLTMVVLISILFSVLRQTYGFVVGGMLATVVRVGVKMLAGFSGYGLLSNMDDILLFTLLLIGLFVLLRIRALDTDRMPRF